MRQGQLPCVEGEAVCGVWALSRSIMRNKEDAMSTVKEQVRQLADSLSDDATWQQVKYELYVREKIAKGDAAIAEGRTHTHEEVKAHFGIR